MKKPNIREGKSSCEWVVATYCDYGNKGTKKIIKLSYSLETAKRAFKKIKQSFTNKGKWRCWQEDKNGIIINDTL